MRFVQIKSEVAQAAAVVFRARDLLVRQRTQIINALRGHLAEFGLVVAKGPAHVGRLVAQAEDYAPSLPQAVRPILGVLIEALHSLDEKIAVLDAEVSRRSEEDEDARRLKTIPGIGPVTAAAISALAPPAQTFARGRDFAAWLGLTPLQRSTGGKQRLGKTSKLGERTLRRLLIIGASAVVRWAAFAPFSQNSKELVCFGSGQAHPGQSNPSGWFIDRSAFEPFSSTLCSRSVCATARSAPQPPAGLS
jgi:transposase